jgi:translocation and assembly module TamB
MGKAGRLTVSGAAPIDGSARLDLAVKGTLEAAVANLALAASGRSVTGRVSVDARAEGALANPRLSGSATLTGGSFRDPLAGVRLDRIEAVVRGEGDQITIQRASATTKNGGAISVSGSIRASGDAGFPADLHVAGHNAELVSSDIVTAVADLSLDLSGPLARRPRIGGRVTLVSMDVTIPNRLPFASQPPGNIRHVNPPAQVRKFVAMQRAQAAQAKRGPPFDADLDLTLSAPSRIFVRGRGVDAELGGDLKLTGALSRPIAVGAFDLRRGRISIASQQLDFSKGAVNFNGDLTPNLDFVASTTAGDVTANVEVSGPANSPTFSFTSTPELPQDEVISRLLFAKAAGGLTASQALQLAQTVAELTGEGGGAFDRLRKSLGVDTLDVGVGADGSPTVGASRYISKNVSVGVKAGAKPEDSGVTVGVDVIPHVRVRGEVDSNGATAAGVGIEWEY